MRCGTIALLGLSGLATLAPALANAQFIPRDQLRKGWTCGGSARVEPVRSGKDWIKWLGKRPTRAQWRVALCNFDGDSRNSKAYGQLPRMAVAELSNALGLETKADYAEYVAIASGGLFPASAIRVAEAARGRGLSVPPDMVARERERQAADRKDLPRLERDALASGKAVSLFLVAQLHYDAQNFAKSSDFFRRARTVGLDDERGNAARAYLALCSFHQGDINGALKAFGSLRNAGYWTEIGTLWEAFLRSRLSRS